MKGLFFIAEIGLNHNGDLDTAKKMIDAAKEAGASAAKFQSIRADKLVSPKVFSEPINNFGFKNVKNVGDFWKKVSIDEKFHYSIYNHCNDIGIEFMSTPFDFQNADLLEQIGVKRFKVASGDLTFFPLLKHLAKKNKPIILSTGASEMNEIEMAVKYIQKYSSNILSILHCVSLYPTKCELANLNSINIISEKFNTEVGFSDHTIGWHTAIAAIAKGATIIEKHFTIDNNLPGPDQAQSSTPEEFKKIVKYGNLIFQSIIENNRKISSEEKEVLFGMRRSIVARKDIKSGTKLTESDLDYKRPGFGISPIHYTDLLGKIVKKSISKDSMIMLEDLK